MTFTKRKRGGCEPGNAIENRPKRWFPWVRKPPGFQITRNGVSADLDCNSWEVIKSDILDKMKNQYNPPSYDNLKKYALMRLKNPSHDDYSYYTHPLYEQVGELIKDYLNRRTHYRRSSGGKKRIGRKSKRKGREILESRNTKMNRTKNKA